MRIAKAIGALLLAVIGLWALGATWVHLRGPDATQAAALAVLEAKLPPLAPERNVADAARLLGHEVPADQRAAALAAVRRRDEQEVALLMRGQFEQSQALPDPLAAYREFPKLPDSPVLCDLRGDDCLARVRADPVATAALLEAHAVDLRAVLALADHDGFRMDREPSLFGIGTFPLATDRRRLVPTALAHRFAQGDTAGALAGACHDLAGWRRIAANSEGIIPAMVSDASALQDVRLLAQLVAALPPGEALPPDCTAALAPTSDAELDLCPAMGNEFAAMRTAADLQAPPDSGLADQLLMHAIDSERMAYLLAPHYAQFCGEAVLAHARADRPFAGRAWTDYRCPRLEFVFDPIDCILADVSVSSGGFASYLDRRTDLAAALALLRTALWLRDTDADPRPRGQRLRERPDSLGLRRHATLDGNALVIDRHDTHIEPRLRLPLAPRVEAGAATP
jgi:hypothetical protein